MSPPRAFDHELLERLMEQNPGWSWHQLTQQLAADNKEHDLPAPSVDAVSRVGRRIKAANGRSGGPEVNIAPPPGTLNPDNTNDTIMRYLREMKREAEGHRFDPDKAGDAGGLKTRKAALGWGARMRSERMVADLTADGVPIERAARPEEIDSKGDLVSVMAWMVPGWRGYNPL